MEVLRPFARRASARDTKRHYIRIRVGTARGKAQKVGDAIECSAKDPAQLTAELAERIADLDPGDGKAFVECLEDGGSDVIESCVIDLAVDVGDAGRSTTDQVVLGTLQELRAANKDMREAVADAYGSVHASQERTRIAQDQRDAAARALFEERVAFERERGAASLGADKPAPMSPSTEKLLLLGMTILGQKLLGGPVPTPDAPKDPAPPEAAGGPTPAELAEAIDEAIDVVAFCVGKLPDLLNQARVRKLATALGLPAPFVEMAVNAAKP